MECLKPNHKPRKKNEIGEIMLFRDVSTEFLLVISPSPPTPSPLLLPLFPLFFPQANRIENNGLTYFF